MHPIVAEILLSVSKTFAVMVIGVAFRRFWARDITPITDLAMNLFVPCLAFAAILRLEVPLQELLGLVGAAVLVIGSMLALGLAAFRVAGIGSRSLLLAVAFANCANLPFPILEANYGTAGLGYGVIYFITNQTLLFSLGILLVSRSGDLRTLLKVPVFGATLLALLIVATGIEPPGLLVEITELLGGAAIPLILFTFGYSLAGVRLRDWRLTLLASCLRLAGGFLIGLGVVRLLGLTGLARDVVILVASMPSAVINVAIAQRYRADPELVASVVFVTTAASVVILPLLLIWLRI